MFRLIVLSLIVANILAQEIIQPVVVRGSSGSRSCPSSEIVQSAKNNLSEAILLALQNSPCGGIGWTQVVSLDMSDPSQQCPYPWTQYNTPARACSLASHPGCQGFTVAVPVERYCRVCGRVVGYAAATPDAFSDADTSDGRDNIDIAYLDGVSLTYGLPRHHIWSFAAGHGGTFRCPCDNMNDTSFAPLPPSFVGDNYFCDGEYNGALWDGQDCTTNCCTFHSPPYFTVTLPASTSDDLEIRICSDHSMYENEPIHVGLLQLYVQ